MPADVPTSADAIDRHLGARLRQLRRQSCLSLHFCGEILGVSHQQMQKYETGVNRMSIVSLVLLARSFGIPPSSFFDGLDTSSPSSGSDRAGGSLGDRYRFPDHQLTGSIARLSPRLQHLIGELALAIEQGETRRSSSRSEQPPDPPIPTNGNP